MKKIISNNIYALKQIWKYSPSLIIVFLFSFFGNILSPIIEVYFLQELIQMVVEHREWKEILALVVFFASLKGVLMIFFNYLNEYFFARKKELVENKLTLEYMQNLRKLDLECFDNSDYYDKYTRAAEEAAQRPILVFTTMVQFIGCLLEIGTLIALMVSMDPVAIIISVVNVVLAVFWQAKKGSVTYQMNMEKTLPERLKKYFFNLFWGNAYAKELRTSDAPELAEKKFEQHAADSFGISKKYLKKILFLNTETATTNGLSFGIMYGYFAFIAYIGKITVGSIAALLVAVSNLSQSLANLFEYLPQFYQHSLYIDNLFPILNYETKIEKAEGAGIEKIESIEFKNVSFSYPNTEHRVLNHVSFQVKTGEKLALVGHNGAGKTTLFKLLCRFYDVDEGCILINGRDIREYNVYELRKHYGIVFQDYKFFQISIAENLLCREVQPGEENAIWDALTECNMRDRISRTEHGIFTSVSKEFDNAGEIFSGGEQQRLAVVKTLLQNPDAFLMDEPSSALDPIAEDQLLQLMNRVSKDKICILITHRLSNVCDADHILLLDSGVIKESGTHAELMNQNGIYCEMFETQAKQYSLEA